MPPKKTMTREEFVEAVMHEIRGHALEAALHERKGSELSLWVKAITGRIMTRAGEWYDNLIPTPQPLPTRKT